MQTLSQYSSNAYALLRINIGLLFAFHGMQKIFGILATHSSPPLFSQIWVGGLIELVGGLLIAIGFKTRWAAFLSSGTMAVAYIQFHWKFQFDSNFFPAINKGELAMVYAFVFLFIAANGPGKWAIDKEKE